MKTGLAIAVLAIFAATTDSSVIPPYVNSDTSDVSSPLVIDYSDVVHSPKRDVYVISSPSSDASFIVPAAPGSALKGSDLAVIPLQSRADWQVGTIGPTDTRWVMSTISWPPMSHSIQRYSVEYVRAPGNIITAARVIKTDKDQESASIEILDGGVGQSSMTIRLTSTIGGGLFYAVEFWGP